MRHRNVTAEAIKQAILRRHLEELQQRQQEASIVNNLYGGGGGGGGMREQMGGGGGESPEDHDYFVDITREDLPKINKATGKPMGWHKKVHRFATPKGAGGA